MKKISIKLFFTFVLALSCLSGIHAQVIEMVYYTPNSQGNYHTITTKDRAVFRSGLTANQLTALGDKLELSASSLYYGTINLNSARDMHILVSTTTASYPQFNDIYVYNGGEFIQSGSNTNIGNLTAAELSGNDITLSSADITIPEDGQLIIDNVPMNNPHCSLGFKSLSAKNISGNTVSYNFAYCNASACAAATPYFCNGSCQKCPCGQSITITNSDNTTTTICKAFSGSFYYMPAIASCVAGWNGSSASSGSPDGSNCIFTGNSVTASKLKCTSDSITLCAAGYVYNNEYLNRVTSAEMANPDILYVANGIPTSGVQCGGLTLTQQARPFSYVKQYVPATGEYVPYPIDKMTSGSCTGRDNFIGNTRTMYCGFKDQGPFSYAQQAIYAMQNNPFCMSSNNNVGSIPSCLSLSGQPLATYNSSWKNLPAEQLCEKIYAHDTTVGDGAGNFSCAVNAPEPESYQAYRTISYNVSDETVLACYGSTCNYNGQNYCRNTVTESVRVAKKRGTGALDLDRWVNVDSQGYSNQPCSNISSTQSNTELLGDSTTTHFLNQKFSAKILNCNLL